MKILYRDLKHGVIKVKVENLDDLWYLSGVLRRGDLVKAKTERRIKSRGDTIREKSVRETITLGIEVENVSLESADTLRISGKIKEGPEELIAKGSHHTFNIQKDSILKIKKGKWSNVELQRLRDAEKSALRPKLLIVVIEEGDVTTALLRETKIDFYDLSKTIGGKYDDLKGRAGRKESFYREISNFILEIFSKEENISGIIISGPGFEQEHFHRFFLDKHPNLKGKTFLEKISSGGRSGIKEVIQKPIMKKISEELSSTREIQLMNKLLEEIGKDSGLGIYGLKEIETASEIGAIELLLVSDDFFLKNREKVEQIIQKVKNKRGKFHLTNNKSEAGQQLNALGGIAGILRFRI
jgi:protein pelota